MSEKESIAAFLSCSVRDQDRPLVEAMDAFLKRRGFRCYTIGKNVSYADTPDESIKKLIGSADCLIGLATKRLSATDIKNPNDSLNLATPYLLQETSMAFQSGIPFLIFKADDVTLQCVTQRNSYIRIKPNLSDQGKIQFIDKPELFETALLDLYQRATSRRKGMARSKLIENAKNISLMVAGGFSLFKLVDILQQPRCFGNYYYRAPECKECDYKAKCKIEKAKLAQ
jgi:hypothetical protein